MLSPSRMTEIRHIAPTAGPEGLKAINELLAEVERLSEPTCLECGAWHNVTDWPRLGGCYCNVCALALMAALEEVHDA